MYLPVRVASARAALQDLPIKNWSEYTFIDIGSGKGRMLFIAAEKPFRRILGVEYSGTLHEAAQANIQRFKARPNKPPIESIHANATDYVFPPGNLVVFLFNPFGPAVMTSMLANLKAAIDAANRHVFVGLLTPDEPEALDTAAWLQPLSRNPRYHLYQTRPTETANPSTTR
jgi:cyclopropane fatty-acyl-phospholipid synthase-like methyltransferase